MKVIFIGPPASGKGTQAEMLAKNYNLKLISTGNLFRQQIKNKTELGQKIQEIYSQGNLMSDEITNQIISQELENISNDFILDGYPRNLNQAEHLKKMIQPDLALEIWISEKESLRRLSGRRVCSCGATYHLEFAPPQKEGICDLCGGKLFQREDDSEEKIKHRWQIYNQQTMPLIDFYQQERILIKINGEQSIEDVFDEILNKIKLKL